MRISQRDNRKMNFYFSRKQYQVETVELNYLRIAKSYLRKLLVLFVISFLFCLAILWTFREEIRAIGTLLSNSSVEGVMVVVGKDSSRESKKIKFGCILIIIYSCGWLSVEPGSEKCSRFHVTPCSKGTTFSIKQINYKAYNRSVPKGEVFLEKGPIFQLL